MRRIALILLTIPFLTATGGASAAGLFEDTEARKAIIDLRQKVQQLEAKSGASSTEMTLKNDQLSQKIDQLPNAQSLLELAGQNDELRDQMARLLGRHEELTRALEILRERVNGMEARLSKLEPTNVTLDGETFAVSQMRRLRTIKPCRHCVPATFQRLIVTCASLTTSFRNPVIGQLSCSGLVMLHMRRDATRTR